MPGIFNRHVGSNIARPGRLDPSAALLLCDPLRSNSVDVTHRVRATGRLPFEKILCSGRAPLMVTDRKEKLRQIYSGNTRIYASYSAGAKNGLRLDNSGLLNCQRARMSVRHAY